MPWDPQQYLKFQGERFAPFEDLIKLVRVREGLRAIDLGCGTGELTARLADALPQSEVLGIDSSAEMLARAERLARPGLRFERRKIEEAEGSFDLVFSNAAIQWVDEHPALTRRLFSLVAPGGQIVIQLPSNRSHPTHRFILDIAGEEPFRTALGGWARDFPVLEASEYAEILFAEGGRDLTVFEKVYCHILPDTDALAEWMSGTALVPYFERMAEGPKAEFLAEYRRRLRARFPATPTLFTFRRILFAATRAGD